VKCEKCGTEWEVAPNDNSTYDRHPPACCIVVLQERVSALQGTLARERQAHEERCEFWVNRVARVEAEREEARILERAAIVADLRAGAGEVRARGTSAWEESIMPIYRELADRYERGEHR